MGLSLTHPQVQPERDYHLYKVIFPLQDYYGFFFKEHREREDVTIHQRWGK